MGPGVRIEDGVKHPILIGDCRRSTADEDWSDDQSHQPDSYLFHFHALK
jgi:hypothetical protein